MSSLNAFIPVGVLLVFALCVCAAIYILTNLLGPKVRGSRIKLAPYESGVSTSDLARLPFRFKFYIVAVLFLLIDVEGAFFLPWALVYRESLQSDATLLVAMLVFTFFVVLGLVYIFRKDYLNMDE